MFHTFLLVLVVSCVGKTSSQIHFGDPCQLNADWDSVTSDRDNETRVVEIPEACLEGDIHWDYPQGNIHVTAVKSNYTYSLCIENSWFTVIGGVVELTGGANNPLPVPNDEEPTCTQEVYGRTELMIVAPETMYYMIIFNYRIVSPQLENSN